MPEPGVNVETIGDPKRYTYAQVEQACAIAYALYRGKFVLTVAPKGR